MDMMTIRKMVMAQMASGLTPISGEFTPSEDLSTYEINPGRATTCFILQEKSGVLQSGKRQMTYCIAYDNNGALKTYALGSNAQGTSWGSVWHWSKVNNTSPISKSGNVFTISPGNFISGMKLLANVTYEWFAI